MPEIPAFTAGMLTKPIHVELNRFTVPFLSGFLPCEEQCLAAVDGINVEFLLEGGDGAICLHSAGQIVQHELAVHIFPGSFVEIDAADQHTPILIVPVLLIRMVGIKKAEHVLLNILHGGLSFCMVM